MSQILNARICGVILSIVFIATSTATAGDKCRSRAEGDLESLKPRLAWVENEWRLSIRYELELEDIARGDTFELILTPLECGRELVDSSGAVVRTTVPIDYQASCRNTKEVEIEDEVTIDLPLEFIEDPYRLRVFAELVCCTTGKRLDDKSNSVKVCSVPAPVIEHVVVREHVEVRETPVVECQPPPPVVMCPPPAPAVIHRVYVPYDDYRCSHCRPVYRRHSVHVDVGWGW